MQIAANNMLGFSNQPVGSPGVVAASGTHFSDLIDPRDTATDRLDKSIESEAVEAARSLVSIGLIQPLLAQIREDPFRSELFHGGQGEDLFGAQVDAILAERITQASGFGIVDSVYRQIHSSGIKVNTHG